MGDFMKPYFIFTRRGLCTVFAAVMVLVMLGGEFYSASDPVCDASTNADRVAFAEGLGIPVIDTAQQRTVQIPYSFSDVYINYNELQKQAGYDLSRYKGCEVILYTYESAISEGEFSDARVNMLVYRGRIIGGDISSVQLGGYMLPLVRQK